MSRPHLGKLFTALKGRNVPTEEEIIANRAKTQTLLDASFTLGEHDVFKEHLENNPVRQDFKGVLKEGIELVLSKTRTMSDVAPTLKVLLENGARWTHDYRLSGRITPYHVICSGIGDHHDLLELMIKELGHKLVNARDRQNCTALICAVQNANVKCVECLIANGADLNILSVKELFRPRHKPDIRDMITDSNSPLIDSINWLHPKSPHSSNIMMDIFDLLLDNGADVNQPCFWNRRTPVMYAAAIDNVNCIEKLIQRGARVNPAHVSNTRVWVLAAKSGKVDVLKYLVEDQGVDKNSVDKDGFNVLYWTVTSGNLKAIGYLMDLGVTKTTTYNPKECVGPCKICGANLMCNVFPLTLKYDPCMSCIDQDNPEVVRLLEEHGCQLYKHTAPLIYAVIRGKLKVVDYLLSNYKYLLNINFTMPHKLDRWNHHETLLTVACKKRLVNMVKLLLAHGADPNKKNCTEKCPSVLSVAILERHVEIIARFIRGGVNMNTSYRYPGMGIMLPFEAAVWYDHIYAAEMLLVSGCSRRVHSLHTDRKIQELQELQENQVLNTNMEPKLQELLKKWGVLKHNVLPLQQRCRVVILSHLSPQADKKIVKLPLPSRIINYLRIPELDDILETFNNHPSRITYVYSD